MKNFLLRFFTWWNGQTFGTQLWTKLYGEFVGEDEFGNRYYRTNGGKIDRGEVGGAVWSEVSLRITEFVEELFLDGGDGDAAAGARVFGETERAVGLGFNDGVADVFEMRDSFPIDLAVASGHRGSHRVASLGWPGSSGKCPHCHHSPRRSALSFAWTWLRL